LIFCIIAVFLFLSKLQIRFQRGFFLRPSEKLFFVPLTKSRKSPVQIIQRVNHFDHQSPFVCAAMAFVAW